MKSFIFRYSFSDFLLLFLGAFLFLCLIFSVLYFLKGKKKSSPFLVYAFFTTNAFSFLGLAIGLSAGLSLSPVVHVLIPAILSFFGGIISYMFILKRTKLNMINGRILVIGISALSFFMMVGMDYSSKQRLETEHDIYVRKLMTKKRIDNLDQTNIIKLDTIGKPMSNKDQKSN